MSSNKRTQPMYEIIQNDIIRKIQTGAYQAGDRIPSEKELMDTWQVSRTTATKALTELSLNGYIHRIQGKGSFANPLGSHITPGNLSKLRPHPDASGQPHRIGVIIPQHYDHHSGNIIRGIVTTLPFPEYFINITLGNDKHLEEYGLNYFIKQGYSGIILFPTDFEFYSDTILKMSLNKYPLVLIDRAFPGIHCMSVTCDNAQACFLGISHLTALGHRGIAFIADAPYREQITRLRYDSYLNVMTGQGLTGISYENFFHAADAADKQRHFLERVKRREITAAITSNAHAAVRLYRLCLEARLQVPGDLSLLCFDNPNFSKQPLDNFFTYLEQNSLDMGRQAALLLQRALSADTDQDMSSIVLTPRLIVNASTSGPLPQQIQQCQNQSNASHK